MMYSQDGSFDDFYESAPEPICAFPSWKGVFAGIFQKNPDLRWGAQLMRISSDMMLVCNENLDILHHNRAFLKGVGYSAGTFTGENLSVFFPPAEREDAIEAFDGLKRGHAAGMRLRPGFLTVKGHRRFDLRVVRSRNGDGSYTYFMVARDTSKEGGPLSRDEDRAVEPLFDNLPVAAWRTDKNLRVLQAKGNLWLKFGTTKEGLIGGDFGNSRCERLPRFLLDLDCSDTLAGMSLQTELKWNGEVFSVSVEPFLDSANNLVGTLGMVRKAKSPPHATSSGRNEPPWNARLGKERCENRTRKVFLEPYAIAEARLEEAAHPVAPSLIGKSFSEQKLQEGGEVDSVVLVN